MSQQRPKTTHHCSNETTMILDPQKFIAPLGLLAVISLFPSGSLADDNRATYKDAPKIDITAFAAPIGTVKVDGFVTDWEGIAKTDVRALTKGQPEYDWTGPRDLSMLIQVQYDRDYLYLAVEIRDNAVHTSKGRKSGDYVEVWIDGGPASAAGPLGRLRMLKLLVGDMANDGPPIAMWGFPRQLKGRPQQLLLDGSIRHTGYFFEVGIPLSLVSDPAPGLEPLSIGFIAHDWDYDDPNEDQATVSSAPFDAARKRDHKTLGKLIFSSADAIANGLSRVLPEVMGKARVGEQFVDVGGDSRRELISLIDNRYLSITGLGLGEGQNYYYELEGRDGGTYTDIKAVDVTGDDKAELILKYSIPARTPAGEITQEFVCIYHFALDRVKLIFFHEIGNTGPGWSVSNEVRLLPNRKTKTTDILITKPMAKGVSKTSYIDTDSQLIVYWERVLLPWEETSNRLFQWSGNQFLKQ